MEDALIDETHAGYEDGVYSFNAFSLSDEIEFEGDGQEAKDMLSEHTSAIFAGVSEHLTAVYAAFNRDYPEVFWLSGEIRTNTGVNYSVSGNTISFTQTVGFVVKADGYDVRSAVYADKTLDIYQEIENVNQAVENILNGIENNATRYEKVKYFNTWLTKNNCYATVIGENSRDCRGALLGQYGNSAYAPVCEGYARAFKVLCDRAEVPCLLVSGFAKEPHMWNMVQMENGNWYLVDVTWNDPVISGKTDKVSGGENEKYLLVGENTVIDGEAFGASHTVNNVVYSGGIGFTNQPQTCKTEYGEPEKVGQWQIGKTALDTVEARLYKTEYFTLINPAYRLIISGNGEMKDFTPGDLPEWSDVSAYIKEMTVNDGITGIGSYAFYGLGIGGEIEIPKTVMAIGNRAFANCLSLGTIILSGVQVDVHEDAFYGSTQIAIGAHLNTDIAQNVASYGVSGIEGLCVYGQAEYTWSEDNTACVGKIACLECGHEVEKAGTVESQNEGAFTCADSYKTTYTATFDDERIESTEKEVVGAITDHVPTGDLLHDENGHYNICECGQKLNEEAHAFGEWKVEKEPSEDEDGEKSAECECGYKKTEKIMRTGVYTPEEAREKGVILILAVILLGFGMTGLFSKDK